MGQGPRGVAQVRPLHVHVAQRDPAGRQARPRPDRDRRLHRAQQVRQAHREPEVLDVPLGRPDELPVLEGPVRGRDGARGRRGPPPLLRGHPRLQVGRVPPGRRPLQQGPEDLG